MTTVTLTIERGIARIELNRPSLGNAIDLALANDLMKVARQCAELPEVRCVVLTGSGRLFCGGGDVTVFSARDAASEQVGCLAHLLHTAMVDLATMPKPLVVLVNGPAAGAGFSLAMLGDVVLAARHSNFTPAYTALGLTSDGGLTWTLPRLVGLRRAQEILLTNKRIDAEEAEGIGLITRVVDGDELEAEGAVLAERLCEAPTAALGKLRQLIRMGSTETFESHLEQEQYAIAAAADSPEGQEGISAFLARKKPNFRGSTADG